MKINKETFHKNNSFVLIQLETKKSVNIKFSHTISTYPHKIGFCVTSLIHTQINWVPGLFCQLLMSCMDPAEKQLWEWREMSPYIFYMTNTKYELFYRFYVISCDRKNNCFIHYFVWQQMASFYLFLHLITNNDCLI